MEACPPDSPREARNDQLLDEQASSTLSRGSWWKRSLALVAGTVATIALLPLIASLAAIVRLDSPGPVFFRQERLGLDGIPFRMWKFRSMYHDSDDGRHRAAASAWFAAQPTAGGYKTLAHPRIPPAGPFLRPPTPHALPHLFHALPP